MFRGSRKRLAGQHYIGDLQTQIFRSREIWTISEGRLVARRLMARLSTDFLQGSPEPHVKVSGEAFFVSARNGLPAPSKMGPENNQQTTD